VRIYKFRLKNIYVTYSDYLRCDINKRGPKVKYLPMNTLLTEK